MDHIGILKRALQVTWRYRVLWLFGILFALVGGGGGGGFNFYSFGGGGGGRDGRTMQGQFPGFAIDWTTVVALLAIVIVVVLLLVIISVILRYVAETALIRLVDDVEETGREPGIRAGWRFGWSPAAWRLFLADLLVNIPFAVLAMLAFMIGLSPLILLLIDAPAVSAVAIVITIGLMLLIIGAIILASIVVNVWLLLAHREIALNNRGVIDGLSAAYMLIRRHLSNVALVWLLLLAVGIGWALLMIPVSLLAIFIAAIAGGVPGLIIYALGQSLPWALLVGIPLGLVAFAVPLTFLGGLYSVFTTAVWTILFRELRTRDALEPA